MSKQSCSLRDYAGHSTLALEQVFVTWLAQSNALRLREILKHNFVRK